MERRKFLKFLGIGTAAAVVAPVVLAEAIEKPIPVIRTGYSHVVGPGLKEQMESRGNTHTYSKLTIEGLEKVIADICDSDEWSRASTWYPKSKFHR